MTTKILRPDRRKIPETSSGGRCDSLPQQVCSPSGLFAQNKTLTVGMNIPMTGDYAPWGLPGLYGCEIIVNNINAAGGVTIGGETYDLSIASYDHGYDTEKSSAGFQETGE